VSSAEEWLDSNEEFRRRVKTQAVPPPEDGALLLLYGLQAPG